LKNHKRIMHAIEIFYMTGKKYSSLRNNTKKVRDFNILKIGLDTDRKKVHETINQRVDQMIERGLVEEARSVFPFKQLNSLNTVGYKELFYYFENLITLEEAIDLIKRNTRRYARRQLTWFKKDPMITWFQPGNTDEILNFLDHKINC
ncbi:MAG TPA: tRNA dimethylallyltransferase, partial [Prolixibacteraceae bacterium]|nr:tRNA dimethylallyltransferase [Prolixibacteraceae bacterium]